MDCSPPRSSVHGIFQARVLEWVAISFSRGSSQPRDRTQVSRIVSKTGRVLLSKSLIQFSIDGWSCVPSLLFTWGQTMVEVMKIMVISIKRPHACTATVRAPNPAAGHHRPTPLPKTPRHPQAKSRTDSCGVTVPFSWVLVHKVLLCPLRVYFPVLCKFWHLYGGFNGDLLQEGLCHTHTQSPCPCGSPLPTSTSTGDAQTQFCLSLCGVPGSWCAQSSFEPSEHLWREWGLILNVNSPLLPFCWDSL